MSTLELKAISCFMRLQGRQGNFLCLKQEGLCCSNALEHYLRPDGGASRHPLLRLRSLWGIRRAGRLHWPGPPRHRGRAGYLHASELILRIETRGEGRRAREALGLRRGGRRLLFLLLLARGGGRLGDVLAQLVQQVEGVVGQAWRAEGRRCQGFVAINMLMY